MESMMARAWLAAVLVGGLVASTPASAQSYSDLFVFGDSLVDSGNARAARLASGGADPAPPAQGYFEGRFSNGYNFADYLSISLGQGPATASLLGGTNFSVGGAQAAEVVGDASPSFAEQIGVFAASGAVFNADSLVLVTLGGNDVRSELAKLGTIPGYTPTLTPALSAFTAGLSSLIDRGARNIVVTGLPDIGQIPAVTLLGSPQLSAAGSQLSFSLNQAFAQTVSSLSTKTTDLNLQFFDLFSYQAAIYADPTMYGLPPTLNTRNACLQVPGAAPACNGYVYFDTVHPTTQVHSAIAAGLSRQLGINAVPEPSTWAMMIVGFGAVAYTMRRRSKVNGRVSYA
jgi:outer membrane lipase/esterase